MYDVRTWNPRTKVLMLHWVTHIQLSMRLFSSLIINYSFKSSCFFFLPTNSAVLSVPAWAAFTLAIPACPVLIAAWVTRSLITGCAHPALLAAAGASDTNAMSSAVRCTNLCGREKREEGIWVDRRERGEIQSVIVKKNRHTSLPRLTGQWKEFLELITLILPDNKNLISILQKRDGHGLQRSAVIDPPICFLILLHSSRSFCDHQIWRGRLFQ